MPDTKGERLQIRLDADAKAILQRAARYTHQSISQFVLDTALQEAKHVIRQHEKVVSLPEADWDAFFEALTNPPEPNNTLQRAYRRYKDLIGE